MSHRKGYVLGSIHFEFVLFWSLPPILWYIFYFDCKTLLLNPYWWWIKLNYDHLLKSSEDLNEMFTSFQYSDMWNILKNLTMNKKTNVCSWDINIQSFIISAFRAKIFDDVTGCKRQYFLYLPSKEVFGWQIPPFYSTPLSSYGQSII